MSRKSVTCEVVAAAAKGALVLHRRDFAHPDYPAAAKREGWHGYSVGPNMFDCSPLIISARELEMRWQYSCLHDQCRSLPPSIVCG